MSKKIKSLVKRECANFNYENNTCFPMDEQCLFFAESKHDEEGIIIPTRCKYFEKGVLPVEPKLECEYRVERKLSLDENIDTCASCGDVIRKLSNRQIYCDKCKNIITKEQKRQWALNNR